MSTNFSNVDTILSNLGATENERSIIYENLAIILHLTNIKFEIIDDEVRVTESTKKNVIIASNLIGIPLEHLENAFIYRSIEVAGNNIM